MHVCVPQDLKELMKPLAKASTVLPASAVRTDPAILLTLGRFIPKLLSVPITDTLQIMKPFSEVRLTECTLYGPCPCKPYLLQTLPGVL